MVLPCLIWILTRLYFIHRTKRRSRSLGDVYQTRFYICLWSEHSGIDRQVVGVVVLELTSTELLNDFSWLTLFYYDKMLVSPSTVLIQRNDYLLSTGLSRETIFPGSPRRWKISCWQFCPKYHQGLAILLPSRME